MCREYGHKRMCLLAGRWRRCCARGWRACSAWATQWHRGATPRPTRRRLTGGGAGRTTRSRCASGLTPGARTAWSASTVRGGGGGGGVQRSAACWHPAHSERWLGTLLTCLLRKCCVTHGWKRSCQAEAKAARHSAGACTGATLHGAPRAYSPLRTERTRGTLPALRSPDARSACWCPALPRTLV